VTDRSPDFDEIVDGDDPERTRLQSVHEMLVAAGPPPELPPSLAAPPQEQLARVIPLPRRRYTAIAAVAVAATVLFGLGYAVGNHGNRSEAVRTIAMAGPAGASASLDLQSADEAGNWPMLMDVEGLKQLPRGSSYTLWLTRDGKLADPCGTFVVGAGTTSVWLNAPYKLKEYSGWVVVRTGTTGPFVLRTTTV
jgi:hypothetical protein